jgi:hypothetical protein
MMRLSMTFLFFLQECLSTKEHKDKMKQSMVTFYNVWNKANTTKKMSKDEVNEWQTSVFGWLTELDKEFKTPVGGACYPHMLAHHVAKDLESDYPPGLLTCQGV